MGRVAKYKKVKKFDLYDEKTDRVADKPTKRKDKAKLPNSFRTMKLQKERMLKLERERIERKKEKPTEKEKGKEKEKKPSQVKFDGIREGETFREFNERLTEQTKETLSGIRVRPRARSNYLRHRKQKLREKKRQKKQEKELDAKEAEMENIPFGEVVDRPPCLHVAPKLKKKANQG